MSFVSQSTIDEVAALSDYDARCMCISEANQGDFFSCRGQIGVLILLSEHGRAWELSGMRCDDRYAPCWNIDNRACIALDWETEIVLEKEQP